MPTNRPVILFFAASTLLALGLSGCTATPEAAPSPDARAQASDPRGVTVFAGDGAGMSWRELVSRAADADAVILGENHGHDFGLAAAAALWEDVLAARRATAALAMEFFERDEQAALDDYLAGLTDEPAFRKASGRTESNYPPGHRAMIEAAKAAGTPVVAANAPRRYVRLARTQGFDRLRALTPEQARLVRIPDELPSGRYYEEFVKIMTQMSASPTGGKQADRGESDEARRRRIDDTFRSQATWDWTMGESVARTLNAGRRPVVLVVGRFHGDWRGGTVQAIERLRPGSRVMVVSFVDAWSRELRMEDAGRADAVVYVGPGASP